MLNLCIDQLLQSYRNGYLTPTRLVETLVPRIETSDPAIWINRETPEALLQRAGELEQRGYEGLPLYGVPFAVKDNIDVAGRPTTAACPDFAYEAEVHAYVVEQLLEAGAILIGKTNMDQFATGLVGVRSPYGVPGNAFDPAYIPGGSSSGSAVAVALGLVSFALGTDTAGSGRVPASFNNLIGFKPTRGRISCRGVVPACRSLDCISIFSRQAADVEAVYAVAGVFDAKDGFSRREEEKTEPIAGKACVAVAREDQLEFFGDKRAKQAYEHSLELAKSAGMDLVPMDISAFLETARLLYDGPWVAERYLAARPLVDENPDALWPATRAIIQRGRRPSAVDAFAASYRLADLRRLAEALWQDADYLLLPTTGTIYTQTQIAADPITLNSNLGRYTNFMNLLDLCGCAVPTAFRSDGMPSGVTIFAPAHRDHAVLVWADRFHRLAGTGAGLDQGYRPNAIESAPNTLDEKDGFDVFVCGAHMAGLPLNKQLTGLGASLLAEVQTAEHYRMYALPATETLPVRPGMVFAPEEGAAMRGEVWRLPRAVFADFMEKISFPLGIGQVELDSGQSVYGFTCDASVADYAEDISRHGGWRAYLTAG